MGRLRDRPKDINLAVAALRLDTLDLYDKPVSIERVKVFLCNWVFWIPGLRKFGGFALCPWVIFLRKKYEKVNDLYTHELCHVWQMQNDGFFKMSYSYKATGYADSPYEAEARFAVSATEDIFVGVLDAL